MSLRYWIIIVFIGFCWGTIYMFNEILLTDLGPMSVSVGRLLTGAAALWGIVLMSGRKVQVSWRVVIGLMILGFFNYAFPFTIYPAAQTMITSTAAGIINALTPVMVVVVASLWPGGEKTPLHKWIGVALGVGGIVVLMQSGRSGGESAIGGLALAVLSPVCYGIALNYARKFKGVDPFVLTAIALSAAGIVYLPMVLAIEGIPQVTSSRTVYAMLAAGPVLTGVLFAVIHWLIQKVGPVAPSTVTFVAPVVSTLLGVFVLQDAFTLWHAGGIALIFLALITIDGALFHRLLPVTRR